MPVLIDTIDTEIEIKSASARDAMPTPANLPGSAAPRSVPLRDAVRAVLESDLEQYIRSRG